jgi:hypothetical protein
LEAQTSQKTSSEPEEEPLIPEGVSAILSTQEAKRKNFESWLVDRLSTRIHKRNLNALIGIYGPPGSGKSYTALRIAELLDPKFSVENVAFTVPELVHLINSGLPPGAALVGDDFGTAANSRTWRSDPNMILSYVAQSFRYRRYLTVITLPDIAGLDSQVRRLFHLSLQTIRKDYAHSAVLCEPRRPVRYMTSSKTYWKFPRTDLGSEVPGARVKVVAFHLPSKALQETYEAKRLEYMDDFYRRLEGGMSDAGRTPKWAEKAILELAGIKTQVEIAAALGISQGTVSKILRRARESTR